MKKILLVIICILSLLFAGCESQEDQKAKEELLRAEEIKRQTEANSLMSQGRYFDAYKIYRELNDEINIYILDITWEKKILTDNQFDENFMEVNIPKKIEEEYYQNIIDYLLNKPFPKKEEADLAIKLLNKLSINFLSKIKEKDSYLFNFLENIINENERAYLGDWKSISKEEYSSFVYDLIQNKSEEKLDTDLTKYGYFSIKEYALCFEYSILGSEDPISYHEAIFLGDYSDYLFGVGSYSPIDDCIYCVKDNCIFRIDKDGNIEEFFKYEGQIDNNLFVNEYVDNVFYNTVIEDGKVVTYKFCEDGAIEKLVTKLDANKYWYDAKYVDDKTFNYKCYSDEFMNILNELRNNQIKAEELFSKYYLYRSADLYHFFEDSVLDKDPYQIYSFFNAIFKEYNNIELFKEETVKRK